MLEVAFDHFGRHGYERVSMDAIASDVGVTKPMLYSYFGSKEGLFAACAERAAEQLREQVKSAAAASDLPPDERLWLGLLAIFRATERHPAAWRVLHAAGHGADPMSVRAAAARDAMANVVADLLKSTATEAGIDAAVAEHLTPLAHALTAATIAMTQWSLRHPDEPIELQVIRLMNLVWMGFGDLLAGRLWLPGAPPGRARPPERKSTIRP
jgi:AcrR family transcriptional regulator